MILRRRESYCIKAGACRLHVPFGPTGKKGALVKIGNQAQQHPTINSAG
ncbi:hypothetical protein X765_01055 [Mesorhizobium sp. LSHC440B00]|nr:hypothetical protein X765_01055 [Mesorhizobium sp. LSHC440B00]ESX40120.1 hypothetical protein X763_07355 [Mesorhizobium sp. LSHC432A00]ESX64544.1 hypothetical protein X757_33050 [Mesorhizobium sp. LSHC414A00]ESZ37804.1 hypothetical protein X731_29370 [Mesorhizobium sp. L2C054A000]